MTRYWVIAPVESTWPELFNNVWEFDVSNGLISIGWSEVGDYSSLTYDDLRETVETTYPDKPPQTISLFSNMLWAFRHEIKKGDVVIARRGMMTIAGIGTVSGQPFYNPKKNPFLSPPDYTHPNFLPVEWHKTPRDKKFSTFVFSRHTLTGIPEDRFQELLEGDVQLPSPTEPGDIVENPNEFVLEKYLQEFIVSNFSSIFKDELVIYTDAEGVEGNQYQTDIGPIDILATSAKDDSFVVIELKKGRASDQVVGQILRYMGWVKQNLCVAGQCVRGLVICRDPDPKLSYALEMTNNIDVRYYSISFKLRETP